MERPMLADYERHLRRRRQSPRTSHLRCYWINRLLDELPDLEAITIDDLEAFLENGDWSENTQQTAIASFRSFFMWAQAEGLVAKNPAIDLMPIRITRTPVRRIASERAIANAIAVASTPDRALILLGAECGLRLAEMAGLHKRDRESAEWLTFVGKGSKERTVWISPELASALDWIEQNTMRDGYYFPGRSEGHAHLTTIWRKISTLIESNPHSLRRRAGTVAYRGTGNDLRLAQELLGHANLSTTQAYLAVNRDDLQRAGRATRLAMEENDVA